MMSEHWPRGTLVTRLYEGDSFALSLIRLSGETRAHRSPSARPAFLTVRRLLYSNDSFHSFSSAEFCSAYLTPLQENVDNLEVRHAYRSQRIQLSIESVSFITKPFYNLFSQHLPKPIHCTHDVTASYHLLVISLKTGRDQKVISIGAAPC